MKSNKSDLLKLRDLVLFWEEMAALSQTLFFCLVQYSFVICCCINLNQTLQNILKMKDVDFFKILLYNF